jgi:hypothetical protein
MGSRTERFGFVTFDNDADTLDFHNYQAFVADRIAMDRLLRIACEAHTHTGQQLSEIPPSAPELTVSAAGGSLPANQPVHYRMSIVDQYGQERLASAPAMAFTAPQVQTPGAPTITPFPGGILPPGDYQYAVSAIVDNADDETAMSNIATGTLQAPNGTWYITLPPLPSGANGWNVYRKGPTEIGFARVGTEYNWLNSPTSDGGYSPRGFQRAPKANTTNITSSIRVDSPTPLGPLESAKIYRTFDASDWESSLAIWTPTLPWTDQGFPTSPGYPPDVSAGVGGSPKIRLGVDTDGTLPTGLIATTQVVQFNLPGPVQVGHWPWQWINEFDQFYIVRLRASLGRNSTPNAQPVRVTVEVSFTFNSGFWMRLWDPSLNAPVQVEIPVGSSVGTLELPAVVEPQPLLRPGNGLRAAVLQTGGGATPTDHDLSIGVIGATQHGPLDRSDWST